MTAENKRPITPSDIEDIYNFMADSIDLQNNINIALLNRLKTIERYLAQQIAASETLAPGTRH